MCNVTWCLQRLSVAVFRLNYIGDYQELYMCTGSQTNNPGETDKRFMAQGYISHGYNLSDVVELQFLWYTSTNNKLMFESDRARWVCINVMAKKEERGI